MSFRLRTDAERWFSELADYPGVLKFDLYYFCLMAGFAGIRRHPLSAIDKPAFIDEFPSAYKLQQNLLLAGLIDAELRSLLGRGVTVQDKPSVHRKVSELLAATGSSTHLSSAGSARMNEYASGGFDLLSERLADKPRKLETFLRAYGKLIAELEEEAGRSEAAFDSAEKEVCFPPGGTWCGFDATSPLADESGPVSKGGPTLDRFHE